MKKLSLIALMLIGICSLKLSAQESIIGEINYNTLEKYIQAAKDNYPRRKIMGLNVEKAKAEVPAVALTYLDLINASYFYRPQDKVAINPLNPYSVNGFQFGVNISLGQLLTKPFLIKKAKVDYKIAQLEAQDFDMILSNEVKIKYYDYIQNLSELKVNSQIALENKGVSENLKSKFEKGEITLDVYNASRINQAGSTNTKIQSEVSFLKAKDALEQVIGKKLEEIK
jgi:outer membrane protein TolC